MFDDLGCNDHVETCTIVRERVVEIGCGPGDALVERRRSWEKIDSSNRGEEFCSFQLLSQKSRSRSEIKEVSAQLEIVRGAQHCLVDRVTTNTARRLRSENTAVRQIDS